MIEKIINRTYKQGQHLTEVVYEFQPHITISIEEAERFLTKVVKAIKVKETHRHINNLPPGFDILCGLKESCLYFGYWPEHQYVRFMASSCKKFDTEIIVDVIREVFNLTNTIYKDTRCDCSIKTKVGSLWC